MSLINDALRRAKEAQKQAPSPADSGPALRPVEPAPTARHNLGLMVPVTLAVVALLGLFFAWQLFQNTGQPVQVAARPAPSPIPAASVGPAHAAQPTPVAVLPSPEPPVQASGSNANTTSPAIAAVAPVAVVTNPPEASAPPPPKPAPLKLQGIVFNPTRPSAMINGKTLFVGDQLGEYQVRAIGQDSATLVSSSQTKVLRLSD